LRWPATSPVLDRVSQRSERRHGRQREGGVGFYGVYDMQAQWLHDQITRPRDQITEKFLGVSPMQNRRIYFDASPTSYATVEKNEKTRTRFLLIYGTTTTSSTRRPSRKSS
jgi:hypothetical protein